MKIHTLSQNLLHPSLPLSFPLEGLAVKLWIALEDSFQHLFELTELRKLLVARAQRSLKSSGGGVGASGGQWIDADDSLERLAGEGQAEVVVSLCLCASGPLLHSFL